MTAAYARLLGWSAALILAGVVGPACYLVDNPEYVGPQAPMGTNVLIRVSSTEAEPIALARVTVAGETRVTDGAGFLRFDAVADGRFVARVDAPGYASAVVSAEVSDGVSAYEEVRLFPLGEALIFDAQAGASRAKPGSETVTRTSSPAARSTIALA